MTDTYTETYNINILEILEEEYEQIEEGEEDGIEYSRSLACLPFSSVGYYGHGQESPSGPGF